MAKLAVKWINLPNASHIHRVLDYMLSNPLAWEDDWKPHIAATSNQHYDTMKHTRKTARGLNRKSEWNSAYKAAWAVEQIVHMEEVEKYKDLCAKMKPGDILEGSPYFMFSHATDAIMALVAYDDCGHMLNASPDEIKRLALICDNPAALLLYPACVAFNKAK